MGRLMDCMSSGRLVGARGGCYKKETFAWTLRCRADRKDMRVVMPGSFHRAFC